MKKLVILFMGSLLLFTACRQDDLVDTESSINQEENTLKAKTFVVNQSELETKYAHNASLKSILQNEFKTDIGLIKTSNNEDNQNGVYIDLDQIQVFESDEIHAITYKVNIDGVSNESEDGEIKEVFNLVYFSTNKVDYYVTLFRYDFSQISFEHFIQNPQLTNQVLTFVPLKDIHNIYENIHSSIFNGIAAKGGVYTSHTIQDSDCSITTYVAGTVCKGKGNPKHNYGEKCGMEGSDRATPGFSYTTYGPCGGGTGSGGDGGGYVGNPGGGGSTPSNPISNPIKLPGDFKKVGGYLSQIGVVNNDSNAKTLKAVSNSLKSDLTEFDSKLSLLKEYGAAYNFKTMNGIYSFYQKLTLPNPTGVNTKIDTSNANASYCGVIHTHPEHLGSLSNKVAPLFSTADLLAVFKFANETPVSPNRKPSEAFIGAVNKYGLYMVMLPSDVTKTNMATKYADFTKTTAIGNKIVGDDKKTKWIDMEKELTKEYQLIESSIDTEDIKKKAHEKALLKIMKKYGLEMNIYFLHRNGGTFNDTWQQVILNNNGQVQYTNIN